MSSLVHLGRHRNPYIIKEKEILSCIDSTTALGLKLAGTED